MASEMAADLLLAGTVVVGAAQVGGHLAARLRQPRVLGEIVAGLSLGPSVLGAMWPAATERLFSPAVVDALGALAQLGLVLFMFLIGLDLDLAHLRGQGHRAWAVSHVSIVAPLALGIGVGWVTHPEVGDGVDRWPFALFVGAAMAVTAFPVLARILQETGLARTAVGSLVIACAAIDDVTAWFVLAAVLAVSQGDGYGEVGLTLGLTVVFVAAMWFVVRPVLAKRPPPLPGAVVLALGSAWVTEAIGVHAIFGAFVAGAILPRVPRTAQVAQEIDPLVRVLLLPVFFAAVGLSTELGLVDSPARWAVVALVLVTAVGGKLGGAWAAARATGSTHRDAMAIGILMNTRGLTEIVILSVGLQAGLIGPTMFAIMVLMALTTTFMAVPLLRRWGPVPPPVAVDV